MHPFDGSDMNRWSASRTDRRGSTFIWNGRTVPVPDRAQCTPEGETGSDLAGAEVYETCAPPYDPQGNNEPRWHLNDRFCTEAEAAGVSTALDGNVWHGPPRKTYAGPASGHPSPIHPPVPGCRREAYCPADYTDGGAIGTALRIRKYRHAWSGATIREEDNRNPSWHLSGCDQPDCEGARRSGSTSNAAIRECRSPGATGNGFLYNGSENLAACYYDHVEPARCPSDCSGQGERRWRVFYECKPTVVSDTRRCIPPEPPEPGDDDYDPA